MKFIIKYKKLIELQWKKRKASRNRILIVSIILILAGLYLSIEFTQGYYLNLVDYSPLALAVILIICYKKGWFKKTKQYEKFFKENIKRNIMT